MKFGWTLLDDYIPISCMGISYKLISKILATRLAEVFVEGSDFYTLKDL